MGTWKIRPILLIFVFLMHRYASPTDWPQWRGPERNGIASDVAGADRWTRAPEKIWTKEIGTGHSSPVILDNRVFTHSRQGDDEVVSSFKLSSGETIWQTKYPAPYKMSSAAMSHGKGPKSTPVIHHGKLVTLGISGILSCFDLESGKNLWSHDFSGVFEKTSPLYGTAMSPIVVGNRVIAHVGGNDQGALRAYSLDSGKLIWSWDEDGPGYASPVLANLEGVEQIVTQSQEKIIGISLKDGSGLWQIPFSTPYVQNIVTPIIFGDLLIFSGLQNGTFAIRLKEEKGRWLTQEVWKNSAVSSYMSSPVLEGNLMFGFSHYKKGQLFCLDPRNGENLWIGPGRQGESAALILSEEFLFVLDTDAEFQVYENSGEGLKAVAEHTVADSPTWAHPVVLGSRVLIKDFSNLTLWNFPAH